MISACAGLCEAEDGVGALAFAKEDVLAVEEVGGRERTGDGSSIGLDVVNVDAAAFDVFAGLAF